MEEVEKLIEISLEIESAFGAACDAMTKFEALSEKILKEMEDFVLKRFAGDRHEKWIGILDEYIKRHENKENILVVDLLSFNLRQNYNDGNFSSFFRIKILDEKSVRNKVIQFYALDPTTFSPYGELESFLLEMIGLKRFQLLIAAKKFAMIRNKLLYSVLTPNLTKDDHEIKSVIAIKELINSLQGSPV
jgi:hypothetical protein